MEIEQFLYDLTEGGEAIVAYTMTSESGAKVQLCNLGASVLSLTLPTANGESQDVASGRCVLGLYGLSNEDQSRFDERLWESWIETNRVIMASTLSQDGVDISMQLVFDFDDDNSFEITYQAFSDGDVEFDLTHALSIDLGADMGCSSSIDGSGICEVVGAQTNILSHVATLNSEQRKVEICSTQPYIYIDREQKIYAPISKSTKLLANTRYIHKTTYQFK